MKITITMDLTSENLNKLKTLLPDCDATIEAPAPIAEPVAEAPAPTAEPEAPTVTKTDVRAIALKLSKAGKQKELAECFAKFGCQKLSDFDARPDEYPLLMKELVKING